MLIWITILLEGQHGAAALWQALRAYSRQKLVNKDAMILPDVKVQYRRKHTRKINIWNLKYRVKQDWVDS